MELLVLGLVLLTGNLVTGRPRCPQDHSPVKEVALDMAPNSFDDQYQDCNSVMQNKLKDLSHTEFANNSVFKKAWTLASEEWRRRQNRIPQTLWPEQAIALLAYSLDCPLHKKFNAAVRQAGRSHEEYLGAFHYKVLHFLLSEALCALRDTQHGSCHHVYRGVEGIHFTANRGQYIRFGQFTTTSLWKDVALSSGRDTLFLVETCYGVPIGDFSFSPDDKEFLIPPFEVFRVTDITRDGNSTIIQLRSHTVHSKYNCEFLKGKECVSQACVSRAGTSITTEPPCLWGLLLAATVLAAAGSP